jgi:hypothetical protein
MPGRPFSAVGRSPALIGPASWPYLWAICREGSYAEEN